MDFDDFVRGYGIEIRSDDLNPDREDRVREDYQAIMRLQDDNDPEHLSRASEAVVDLSEYSTALMHQAGVSKERKHQSARRYEDMAEDVTEVYTQAVEQVYVPALVDTALSEGSELEEAWESDGNLENALEIIREDRVHLSREAREDADRIYRRFASGSGQERHEERVKDLLS